MAEIGVIASVLTLTGAGTQLARSLYGICDDFRHAPRQIERFARKISLLSDALQQVRDTIRANPDCYNEKGEQRIMIIVRSCRKDFYEIRHELDYRSSSRRSSRVSWLFKKQRADELFRSLDSQTSALQIMTNVVGLAAALREQKKLQRQSEEQYNNLKAQSNEQHENLQRQSQEQHAELQSRLSSMELLVRTFQEQRAELKRSEKRSGEEEKAVMDDYPVDYAGVHLPSLPDQPPPVPPAYTPGRIGTSRIPKPQSPSTVDLTYEDYPMPPMHPANPFGRYPYSFPGPTPYYANNSQVARLTQRPLRHSIADDNTTSDALLQVIPWTAPGLFDPDAPPSAPFGGHSFVYPGHNVFENSPPQSRPTDIVRYLVETYTGGPIEVLDDILAKDIALGPESSQTTRLNAPRPVESYGRYNIHDDEVSEVDDYPMLDDENSDLAEVPGLGARSNSGLHEEGSRFLAALSRTRGSFISIRGNDNLISFYSGRKKFYQLKIKSADRKKRRSGKVTFTRIGKGWVQEDLLKAHHFAFCEVDGYWHIYKALHYDTLEELVRLSYGALMKKMHAYGQEPLSELASAPIFNTGSFYPPHLLSSARARVDDRNVDNEDRDRHVERYRPLYRAPSANDSGSETWSDEQYTSRVPRHFDRAGASLEGPQPSHPPYPNPNPNLRIYPSTRPPRKRSRQRYATTSPELGSVYLSARPPHPPPPAHPSQYFNDAPATSNRQPEARAMMPGSTGFILPYSAGRLLTANSWHEDDVRGERDLSPERLPPDPATKSVASATPEVSAKADEEGNVKADEKANAKADKNAKAAPKNQPSVSIPAANSQQKPPSKKEAPKPAPPPKMPRPVKVESESSAESEESIEDAELEAEASDGDMDLYE